MPRKKRGKCPICVDGKGKYFVIVEGAPALIEKECPIDGRKKAPKPVVMEPVQTSLVGSPT